MTGVGLSVHDTSPRQYSNKAVPQTIRADARKRSVVAPKSRLNNNKLSEVRSLTPVIHGPKPFPSSTVYFTPEFVCFVRSVSAFAIRNDIGKMNGDKCLWSPVERMTGSMSFTMYHGNMCFPAFSFSVDDLMLKLYPDVDETVHGCSAALRARTTNCVELLDRCMARVNEWESSVHAWVSLDREAARQTAMRLDRELADGRDRGPLHGIPLGVKDIFDVKGCITAAGSKAWAAHPPRAEDCSVVSRLRDAGAIILGKTVTTQFAGFDPPVTRNPWHTDHTPGGSSSGSAAAVATGMCLAALGSQTGGSITRPAAFCGVTGCKPSFGTVSLRGVVPLAKHLDHPGPIARCVADLAILLNVIRDTPDAAISNLSTGAVPSIGWIHGVFDELSNDDARAAVAIAVKILSDAGASVVDVELPREFDGVHEQHGIVMAVEAAASHRSHFAADPDDYAPAVKSLIERGLSTSERAFAAALDCQLRLRTAIRSCFADVDILICPAATDTAPDGSTTGDPAMNSPWSFTGSPTVSIPIQLAANGLPLAVQFVGRFGSDSSLLNAALWCEVQIADASRGMPRGR